MRYNRLPVSSRDLWGEGENLKWRVSEQLRIWTECRLKLFNVWAVNSTSPCSSPTCFNLRSTPLTVPLNRLMRTQIYEQRLTRLGSITSRCSVKEHVIHVYQTRESGRNRAYNKMGDPVKRANKFTKLFVAMKQATLLNLSTGVGGHP